MDFEKLLDTRPVLGLQVLEIGPEAELSATDFELLQSEMVGLRAAIEGGHQPSIAEMRRIVLFFRARRGKLFTVAKVKKAAATKNSSGRTPVRRKTPASKLKDMDALELFTTLGL